MTEFITFINELVDDEFYQAIEPLKAEDYFASGGCYEFAKILKAFLPESKIMVRKDHKHLAVFYKGNLYDAKGVCQKEDFQDITEEDEIRFADSLLYGIPEIKFERKEVAVAVTTEMKNCVGFEKLLEKVTNIEEPKQKCKVMY